MKKLSLANVFVEKSTSRNERNSHAKRTRALRLESLESRELLSVAPGGELLATAPVAYESGAATFDDDILDLSVAMLDADYSTPPAPTAGVTSLVVTSAADVVDANDGVLTLREALSSADSGATITFLPTLAGTTITLKSQIKITKSVTIDASALWDAENNAPGLTLDGAGKTSLFEVAAGTESDPVTFQGLTFSNGYHSNHGGAINVSSGYITVENSVFTGNRAKNWGGAIDFTNGSGTLVNSSFKNNSAAASGGGAISMGKGLKISVSGSNFEGNSAQESGGAIYANGTVTIYDTVFTSNSAGKYGGAVFVVDNTTATFTDSTFDGNSAGRSGGAINADGAVEVVDCLFTGNRQTSSDTDYGGGAIQGYTGSSVTVSGSTFQGNSGYRAGAIYAHNLLTITNSTFTANTGTNHSGAVGVYKGNSSAAATIDNCVFTENAGKQGGGIYSTDHAVVVTNSVFTSNTSTQDGGAAYFNGPATVDNVQFLDNSSGRKSGAVRAMKLATFTNSTFDGNTSYESAGALTLLAANSLVDACVFTNNSSTTRQFGAVCIYTSGAATIRNSLFTNNRTLASDCGDAGAIGIYQGTLNLENSLIYGNSSARFGGGIALPWSGAVLNATNVTIANNDAAVGGNDLYLVDPQTTANFYNTIVLQTDGGDSILSSGALNFYNTLTSGAIALNSGVDNITYDASKSLFKDATSGDYTLAPNSQALDRGNNQYATASVDLAGNARIYGGAVDLGAYEFQKIQLDAPADPRETAKTETTVTVAWDAVPNATGYKIAWRNKADSTNSYVTLNATKTSYKLTGLEGGASYYWKVVALGDGVGYLNSAYTSARIVTPRVKLDAPTLSASAEQTSITVSWNAVPNASRYYVSYKLAGATEWSNNINVGTNLARTINGLEQNAEYDVRVKAIGDGYDYSTSDYATATVTTQTPEPKTLTTPTNPRETAKTETSITVAWDAVPNASGYKIAWRNKTDSANSYISLNAATTSYQLTGLDAGASYYWKVVALGDGVRYLNSAYTAARTVKPRQKLAAPTLASDADYTSIAVSWNAVPNAVRYYVSYKLASATEWSDAVNVGTNLSYTINELEQNTQYKVRVRAIGDALDYASSGYSTITVSTLELIPETTSTVVTTNLDVVDPYDGEISLREALDYASPGAAITFADSLKGKTIALDSELGELTASKSVTIDASSLYDAASNLPGLTVSGENSTRVMHISGGCSVVVKGLKFANARTTTNGGAVLNDGDLSVENCLFSDNVASYETSDGGVAGRLGGAIFVGSGAKLVATSTSFIGNDCQSVVSLQSQLSSSFTDCSFKNNGDRAVEIVNGEVSLIGCDITDNHRHGVIVEENGVLVATNCLVARNVALWGGGLKIFGKATLYNCTIVDNMANEGGGGVSVQSAAVLNAYNTIIVGNTATSGGNDVHVHSGGVANAYNTLSSYSSWKTGANNMSYDVLKPLFTNKATGDYTLVENSQAVDKGNNQYASTSVDLAGKARIVDGTVDVGAYEYQGRVEPVQLDAPVLTVSSKTETTITVSWDAVPNADRYSLSYRLTGSTTWTNKNVGTNTSYTITGLEANTEYDVRLKAVGDGVNYKSVYSAILRAQTDATPTPPVGPVTLETPVLSVSDKTGTTITVSWDAVPNAERYSLSYKLANMTEWKNVNVGTNVSHTITGLERSTEYDLRLKAIGDGTNYKSVYSAVVRAQTTAVVQLDAPVPSVTAKTATSITASWNAVPNANGYRFIWKNQSDSAYTVVFLDAATTSHTITGLDNGATYVWKVLALGNNVAYLNSDYCETQRDKPQQTLATPVLTVSVAPSSLTVAWNAVPNASRYSLSYRLAGASTWTNVNVGTNLSCAINGLEENVEYDVRLKAIGDGINYKSVYSSIVRAQTDASSSSVLDDGGDNFFDELAEEDFDLLAENFIA